MTIDHVVLVAEAQRRLDQARALDGEEWDAQLPGLYMNGWSGGIVRKRGGPWRVQGSFAGLAAEHIEVWDPAAAVAVCEGWLDVLRRHRPMDSAPRFCTDCRDHVLLTDCLEVRAVARQMRMEASEPPATPKVTPCPEGFHWIGQPWTSCDECGLPAWEHEGMTKLGPSGSEWVLQPWAPGEREATRAKWEGH